MKLMGRQWTFAIAMVSAISLGLGACGKDNKNKNNNQAPTAQATEVQNLKKALEEANKRLAEIQQTHASDLQKARDEQDRVNRRKVDGRQREIDDLKRELDRLRRLENVQDQTAQLERKIADLEAQLAQSKSENEVLKQSKSEIQTMFMAILEEIKNGRVAQDEKITQLIQNVNRVGREALTRQELDHLKEQMRELLKEASERPMQAVAQLAAQVRELAKAVGDLQAASSRWATKEDVEAAKSTLEQAQQKLEQSIVALEQKVGQENPAVAELKTAVSQLTQQISTITSELNDLKGKIGNGTAGLAEKITELAGKFGQIEQTITALADRIKVLENGRTTPTPTECPEGQERGEDGKCKPKTDTPPPDTAPTVETCQAKTPPQKLDTTVQPNTCVEACNGETQKEENNTCVAKDAAPPADTAPTVETCQAMTPPKKLDKTVQPNTCVEACNGETQKEENNTCVAKDAAPPADTAPTVETCQAMTPPKKLDKTVQPNTCVEACNGETQKEENNTCVAKDAAPPADTAPTVETCQAMTPPKKLDKTVQPNTCVEACNAETQKEENNTCVAKRAGPRPPVRPRK